MRPRGRYPGRWALLAAGDAAMAVASFAAAVLVRRQFRFPGTLGTIPAENVPLDLPWFLGVAACAVFAGALVETWDEPADVSRERGSVLLVAAATGALLLLLFFLAGRAAPRTVVLPLFVPLFLGALAGWRRFADRVFPIRRRMVLVVGSGPDAHDAAGAIARGEISGHLLAAALPDPGPLFGPAGCAVPEGVHDLVFVPSGTGDRSALVGLVEASFAQGFDLWLLQGVLDVIASRPATRRLGDLPLTLVEARGTSLSARTLRRILDLVFGVPLFLLALPVVALGAAAIVLESPGQPFYRQRRVGRGGREFELLKLRTMFAGAEEESGPVLARPGDARITKVGAFLRQTRIDELPQLLLVVTGTMSLIGPRPERPVFASTYETEIPAYRLRYLMKPGMTGLAQVMGAYASRTDVKIRYDLGYLFHWSPLLDLFILARTVTTVLRASGL